MISDPVVYANATERKDPTDLSFQVGGYANTARAIVYFEQPAQLLVLFGNIHDDLRLGELGRYGVFPDSGKSSRPQYQSIVGMS